MTVDRPVLRGLVIGDDPGAWRAAGFAVGGDVFTVGGVTIHLAGADGPRGIRGWWLDGAVAGDAEGLAWVADPPTAVDAVTHPNHVTGVDHVVAATADVDRTTAALEAVGLRPRHTASDVRGRGATYRFFLLGTALLEVIAPATPDPDVAGAHFVGLAFVGDPDRLGGLASEARDAVQPGRRIATLHTGEHDISVPLAVMSPRD